MQDKELECIECGEKFVITVDDQQWYASKGFKEPKRCKNCRRLRRAQVIGGEGTYHGEKKENHK